MTLQETETPRGHRYYVDGQRVRGRGYRALERAMDWPAVALTAAPVSH